MLLKSRNTAFIKNKKTQTNEILKKKTCNDSEYIKP